MLEEYRIVRILILGRMDYVVQVLVSICCKYQCRTVLPYNISTYLSHFVGACHVGPSKKILTGVPWYVVGTSVSVPGTCTRKSSRRSTNDVPGTVTATVVRIEKTTEIMMA